MKVKNKSSIAITAEAAEYYGLKPYPLGGEGRYKYLEKWSGKQFEKTNYNFSNAKGIALFAGVGGLETLDIDAKNDGPDSTLVSDFLEILSKDDILSDVKFCYVRTKSNGLHIHYKTPKTYTNQSEAEEHCEKSQHLAHNKNGRVIIETLGFGKLVTIPPTKGYRIVSGCETKLKDLPTLTSVQLDRLYTIAKGFNKYVKKVEQYQIRRQRGLKEFKETHFDSDSYDLKALAELYNARTSCSDLLISLGWTEVKRDAKGILLRHPNATNSHSARVLYSDESRVTFFSMGNLQCEHLVNKKGYAWTTAFNLALDCKFGGSWSGLVGYIRKYYLK